MNGQTGGTGDGVVYDPDGAAKKIAVNLARVAEQRAERERRTAAANQPGIPGEPVAKQPALAETGPRRLSDEEAEALLIRAGIDVAKRGKTLAEKSEAFGRALHRIADETGSTFWNGLIVVLISASLFPEQFKNPKEHVEPTPVTGIGTLGEGGANYVPTPPHVEDLSAITDGVPSDANDAVEPASFSDLNGNQTDLGPTTPESLRRISQPDEIGEVGNLDGGVDDTSIPWSPDGSIAYELRSLEADGDYVNPAGLTVNVNQPNLYVGADETGAERIIAFGYQDNTLWETFIAERGFDPATVLLYSNDGHLNTWDGTQWQPVGIELFDPRTVRDSLVSVAMPPVAVESDKPPLQADVTEPLP